MNPITRRAALGGLALLPATTVAAVPAFSSETAAQRCLRLAEELSAALSELDGGNWKMSVRPLLDGKSNVHAEPLLAHKNAPDLPRNELLDAYLQWLDMEARLLRRDMCSSADEAIGLWGFVPCNTRSQNFHHPLLSAFEKDNATWAAYATPATRALTVLTTVGCDLRPLEYQA